MKRKSFWGLIPFFYIVLAFLFFAAYLQSAHILPQIPPIQLSQWFSVDPETARQKQEAKEAAKAKKEAAKEAARLAKEEARRQKEAAEKKEINPVSLEAVSRYQAVTEAVFRTAYNRFINSPVFDEEQLNRNLPAMNAYRLQKGLNDFPSAQIAEAAKAFRGRITLEAAAAGAGDIMTAERNRRNEMAAALPGLRDGFSLKEPTPFDNSRLTAEMIISAVSGFGKETAEPLLKAYESFDRFSPAQLAGFIDVCRRLDMNLSSVTAVADLLISRITKEGGVYTVGNDDSVYCGQVLTAAGIWKQNKRWEDVGKTLVASYWETHPEVPFEEFYDLFDERYYPRLRTVTVADNRYKIYTCAEKIRFAFSEGTLSVTFDEPMGETFFFLLYGLPQLPGYRMYNLNWNRDPYFQNYYAGSYFDENRDLFFVKILIKTSAETIYLQTQPIRQNTETEE